jgi:hypothetical protein
MTTKDLLILSLVALLLPACTDKMDGIDDDDNSITVTYETPRELIGEMNRLQSGVCSLACQMAIAGMYSTEYLKAQRAAAMYGISNQDTRREMLLAFFGAEIALDQLEAMTDQEFFARQLLHFERMVPADVIMRHVEIIREEILSKSEVKIVVARSGLEIDPDYTEEGIMNFVLEEGVWKIKS